MQKRNISFGQVGLVNTSSPHPKREKPQYHKNKKEPLKDKQSAEQFMQSFFNINHLLGNTLQHKKGTTFQNHQEFPLANHLTGYYAAKKSLQVQPKFGNTTGNHKYHFVQTTNKTQQTFIDEESEYQNYLKQYQTVIKNSRSKEFVSPMAHKKEIDELITQFLSDIQDSDIKSTDLSPKSNKMQPNKTEKQQKHERSRSPTPEVIKVQKIDLTNLKANSFQSSHNKSNKKDTVKFQRQNLKRKQNGKNNKEQLSIVKIQRLSPRFSDQKKQMNRQQKYQTINMMNNREKSNEKLKIQVIKVQDLRTKNNNTDQKQKKNIQYSQNVVSIPHNIKKAIPETTFYSNSSNGSSYSNSYLQQNIYKISRTQQKKQTNDKSKGQQNEKEIKKTQQHKGKKPLKIQIEISEEFDDQEPKIELDSSLQKEKTQIIRMVSKKVSNMIQDTQKIAINKAK